MIFADSAVTDTIQTTVNEAVDTAKSNFHRITMMWIFTGVAVGLAFVGQWVVGTILVGSLMLRLRTVPISAAFGIGLVSIAAAYMCFLIAIGLFIVNTFSLIIWRARYGGLATSDSDFANAKRQWLNSVILWAVMTVLVVLPAASLVTLAYLA